MEQQPHDEVTAYHEAGHAVIALALGRTVHKVSALPNRVPADGPAVPSSAGPAAQAPE